LKNILFFTQVSVDSIYSRGLYTDLFKYFKDKGHHVIIFSPLERRNKEKSKVIEGDGFKIVRYLTPNINKVGKVEKAVSLILYDHLLRKAIKKHLTIASIDIVIYSTPPITITRSINFIKKKYRAFTYLLLKDIFPQNAIDLKLLPSSSFLTKAFLKTERQLYQSSDKIGCMSQANVDFLLRNHKYLHSDKVEICPNGIIVDEPAPEQVKNNDHRLRMGIPVDSVLFIYGGNLGKPQGIDFLIKLLNENLNSKIAFFLIIGNGTEYSKLSKWAEEKQANNVLVLSSLPKKEYDLIVSEADVGLILLDHRFTIPNYPSRLLGYLSQSLPVLAFTDEVSDIGTNASNRGYGDYCSSKDISKAVSLINEFSSKPKSELEEMGNKGYNYLVNYYQVSNCYDIVHKSYLAHKLD